MKKQTGFLAKLAQSSAVVAALALPAFAEENTAATVVATVNGTQITLGHMQAALEALPPQYQQLPDDALFKGLLEQLVQQTALEQSVGELSAKDNLVLENERRAYLSGVAIQKVMETAVTDATLQAAYDAKFKDFAPSTEYNAAHILVEDEAKANELKAQIEGGADFAELAKANSTDPGSGANGGDLGWFGLGMMVKPFEEAVIAAEPGKVAGPVKSDFGYHLILVKETRPTNAPSLDEVRDELANEVQSAAIEAHVKELTDKAEVTRPGEGIDPAVLRDQELFNK